MAQHLKVSWIQLSANTDAVEYLVYMLDQTDTFVYGKTEPTNKINPPGQGNTASWASADIPSGSKRIIIIEKGSNGRTRYILDTLKSIQTGQPLGSFNISNNQLVPANLASVDIDQDSNNNGVMDSVDPSYVKTTIVSSILDKQGRSFLIVTKAGGTGVSEEPRALYAFAGDVAGSPPSYSGSDWPVVKIANTIKTVGTISATLANDGNGNLTINGLPCYQYSLDVDFRATGGTITNWLTFGQDGTLYNRNYLENPDDDSDGDGIPNEQDADHPSNANKKDTDGDGIIDDFDPDDDNDGVLDGDDADPLDPNIGRTTDDSDGDGITDDLEIGTVTETLSDPFEITVGGKTITATGDLLTFILGLAGTETGGGGAICQLSKNPAGLPQQHTVPSTSSPGFPNVSGVYDPATGTFTPINPGNTVTVPPGGFVITGVPAIQTSTGGGFPIGGVIPLYPTGDIEIGAPNGLGEPQDLLAFTGDNNLNVIKNNTQISQMVTVPGSNPRDGIPPDDVYFMWNPSTGQEVEVTPGSQVSLPAGWILIGDGVDYPNSIASLTVEFDPNAVGSITSKADPGAPIIDSVQNDPGAVSVASVQHDPNAPATVDAVEPDRDGDGVPNAQDAFPDDPTEWTDADGDGIGSNTDFDDNNASVTIGAPVVTMNNGTVNTAEPNVEFDTFDIQNPIFKWPHVEGATKYSYLWTIYSKGTGYGTGSGVSISNNGSYTTVPVVPGQAEYAVTLPTLTDERYLLIRVKSFNENRSPVEQQSTRIDVFCGFTDTDGDGVVDIADDFPNNQNEWKDTDGDGVGDNSDFFPNDPSRQVNHIPNAPAVPQIHAYDSAVAPHNGLRYPLWLEVTSTGQYHTNLNNIVLAWDGTTLKHGWPVYTDPTGNNTNTEIARDHSTATGWHLKNNTYHAGGFTDSQIINGFNHTSLSFGINATFEPAILSDFDGDGIPDDYDSDDDNDGTPDASDDFPFNSAESNDNDGDGIGDNADPDDDNDGTLDGDDEFPFDPNEDTDSDNDGVGDNADTDDDNDGTPDTSDAFPFNPNEDTDSDNDGVGDNADPFPNDPSKFTKQTQTITLQNLPSSSGFSYYTGGGGTGVIGLDSASVTSSGLPVQWSIHHGTASIASIQTVGNSNSVVVTGTGVITILANQPGDNQYFPAPQVQHNVTIYDDVTDTDGDGVVDYLDNFDNNPLRASGTDTDGDGTDDEFDTDDDGDGVPDDQDDYPLDPTKSVATYAVTLNRNTNESQFGDIEFTSYPASHGTPTAAEIANLPNVTTMQLAAGESVGIKTLNYATNKTHYKFGRGGGLLFVLDKEEDRNTNATYADWGYFNNTWDSETTFTMATGSKAAAFTIYPDFTDLMELNIQPRVWAQGIDSNKNITIDKPVLAYQDLDPLGMSTFEGAEIDGSTGYVIEPDENDQDESPYGPDVQLGFNLKDGAKFVEWSANTHHQGSRTVSNFNNAFVDGTSKLTRSAVFSVHTSGYLLKGNVKRDPAIWTSVPAYNDNKQLNIPGRGNTRFMYRPGFEAFGGVYDQVYSFTIDRAFNVGETYRTESLIEMNYRHVQMPAGYNTSSSYFLGIYGQQDHDFSNPDGYTAGPNGEMLPYVDVYEDHFDGDFVWDPHYDTANSRWIPMWKRTDYVGNTTTNIDNQVWVGPQKIYWSYTSDEQNEFLNRPYVINGYFRAQFKTQTSPTNSFQDWDNWSSAVSGYGNGYAGIVHFNANNFNPSQTELNMKAGGVIRNTRPVKPAPIRPATHPFSTTQTSAVSNVVLLSDIYSGSTL